MFKARQKALGGLEQILQIIKRFLRTGLPEVFVLFNEG
ncbi:hypothetical protein A33Q_4555 [Indibacter alkaliphilus LW1]|jgi:hypothetical protein|uniref:Uncharacterized protein n=1 Tax=Indibacter alkaliphilus (strain CCUG 57479 / KCTC 22604 / LW1) TaxID=1189612 RepID=S2CWE3_INDAL|nr:hypothetical protein A33Q_4555 [Indibacter alkaliphilus LW1]